MAEIRCRKIDYANKADAQALAKMLRAYSSDPMGGGEALSEAHCKKAAGALQDYGQAFTVLAFDKQQNPVGMATCFSSFSTFKLKPLVNIHDFFVDAQTRGQGVGMKLLEKVAEIAVTQGCCKLTLEVLSNNEAAKNLYRKFGFAAYELLQETGQAMFWQKAL